MTTKPVLDVDDLRVELAPEHQSPFNPVDGVSFVVAAGECLGIVGESGCGKSLTLKAVIGLLPADARVASGRLRLGGSGSELREFRPEHVRGRRVAMVFQEPMTALNPTMRVIDLIAQGPRVNLGMGKHDARSRALELMREVGIPDPPRRARAWPWELSGGLRQRVMIAMALSCEPDVLLCDEPTTALDVTVQDQILRLLDSLRRDRGLAVVFVTHDLAVVGQIAQRVAVMYAGRVVETGPVAEVFRRPRHPYTAALLRAAPTADRVLDRFVTIGGSPPDPRAFPTGCRFAPRCTLVEDGCRQALTRLVEVAPGHASACRRADDLGGQLP